MTGLTVKSFPAPDVNVREVLRYARADKNDDRTKKLIDECLDEALPRLSYKTVYAKLRAETVGNECRLGSIIINSSALAKCLSGVNEIILVTATVGLEMDRLIAKYSRTSPAKALIMQAIGAERVESLLDELTRELTEEYGSLRPRFSVGYGDAPLSAQKEITNALDTARTVGVFLSDTCILTPTKSVTDIIGIDICNSQTL
jgi:hypothetical protein